MTVRLIPLLFFVVLFFVVLCFPSPTVLAHSGGTDSNGCHVQSSTGTRHCHNSKGDDNWKSVGGALLGVLVVVAVYTWWKKCDEQALNVITPEPDHDDMGVRFAIDSSGNPKFGVLWELPF